MLTTLFICLTAVVAAGYLFGKSKARHAAKVSGERLHSLPGYHGAYVAFWVGLPCFVLVLAWLLLQDTIVEQIVIAAIPADVTADLSASRIDLLISEIKSVAAGRIFGEPEPYVRDAAQHYNSLKVVADQAMFVATLALGIICLVFARRQIAAHFRARQGVGRFLDGLMILCSVIAIVTTLGIVASLLFEAIRFFEKVPPAEFFFGLSWEPQIALRPDQVAGTGAFGAVPVFAGTLLIALIAMLVAIPIGLYSAIYLTEYAGERFRTTVKPVLEMLAGVPTVVYGFFAVLTVAPALRAAGTSFGLDIAPNSALAAGAVMGIMIIPFISSLSDDAIAAVPRAMRDGSYAMGATKAETITRVLLPAALPGIVGGILLAVSRAIGETMIVVMAAGLIAKLTANPLDAVTTVTVQIVTLLIGDTEFDNPKTLAAFALGLVLFVATLLLNIVALRVVQKYRERYE
ncbi:phosphate ABC transporter permease subunit PstC [Tepidicaulis sp. LMO-SS28]|uniref:phosphate ABC transporter permease subunit PstC n=1 Tax=Tepidicaulis sp. LMO-SS28 TaxID=3447455 RepID=UPI003EE1D40A